MNATTGTRCPWVRNGHALRPFRGVLVTERQEALVLLIERHPGATVRRLAGLMGIRSPNGLYAKLTALRQKGLVRWDPARAGTLRAIREAS